VSFPTVPPLSAPGFSLRAWQSADAPALAQVAGDDCVWRWMSDNFPKPYTLEVAQHWCERGHIDFGGENGAISLDGVAVGGAGYQAGSGFMRCSVEIGYFLAPAHQGRGVGTAVVAALTQLALALPETTRVFAPVHAGNAASMRVLAKNGFVCEGTQRLSAFKAGRVIDRVIWARYREPAALALG
jgi:RimJ/RimL family protein N-acetyltransferase